MEKRSLFIILGIAALAGLWLVVGKKVARKGRFGTEKIGDNRSSISDNISSKGGEKQVDLSGKKILMVLAPEDFRDKEYEEPRKVLEGAGAEVTVASKEVSEARGAGGAKVSVDREISGVSAADFDAVIFVGGPGAEVYFDDISAHRLAKDTVQREKVLGAICIAPSILANAGLLDGKQATAFSSEAENLREEGAEYTGEAVTVDGLIVTANGPGAARKFGEAVASALE